MDVQRSDPVRGAGDLLPQARATQQHAADLADILRHGPDGETDAARQAREQDLRGARLRADDASGELAAILREAHALEERTFGAAEQAARQIRAAAEQAPYREPNLLQQGLDQLQRGWESTKEWVAKHAEVLHTISGVLKGIAAGAAVVALAIQVVPVLGQIASTIPLTVAAITGVPRSASTCCSSFQPAKVHGPCSAWTSP